MTSAMTEPKITREQIEGFIRTLECGQDPFASGEIDVHYICTLALQALDMEPRQEQWTYGHCAEKQKPGGCQLHNLFCTYPDCDRRPAT